VHDRKTVRELHVSGYTFRVLVRFSMKDGPTLKYDMALPPPR